jgi:hypothetical protein
MILYYCLMTKWSGLGDSTELSRMGLSQDVDRIQQYRPICLLNCLYKWITKVLNIKMEKYAG